MSQYAGVYQNNPHPCRGCKGGAGRNEAGVPGRQEFTALFRLRFGDDVGGLCPRLENCHSCGLMGIVSRKGETFHRGQMIEKTSKYWIEKLRLEPHPEGGYFRQTYKADLTIAREALPAGFAAIGRLRQQFTFYLKVRTSRPFIDCDRMRCGTSMRDRR